MEKKSVSPTQQLLKQLLGKCKPEIFRLVAGNTLRFSNLLRKIEGSNKQTLSVALKELEKVGFLQKVIVQKKPLHTAYSLTEAGKLVIPIIKQLEGLR